MWVQSLSWGDPLEEGMATYSSILAGQSMDRESLVGYSPQGCKESDMPGANQHSTKEARQSILSRTITITTYLPLIQSTPEHKLNQVLRSVLIVPGLQWGIKELSVLPKPISDLYSLRFGARFHFHISILFSARSTHKSVVSGLQIQSNL